MEMGKGPPPTHAKLGHFVGYMLRADLLWVILLRMGSGYSPDVILI